MPCPAVYLVSWHAQRYTWHLYHIAAWGHPQLVAEGMSRRTNDIVQSGIRRTTSMPVSRGKPRGFFLHACAGESALRSRAEPRQLFDPLDT